MERKKNKSIMYLTKVGETGRIQLKRKDYKKVTVIILDKLNYENVKPCFTRIEDVLYVSGAYFGLDACCFCEY